MNIKKHIPNAITCCNLLCGCLAIVQAFEGNLVYSAYLVGLAAIFDFFDGFAARMLKVSSPIGKDLDSLADMVTFGVVPGIVMYKLIHIGIFNEINVGAGQPMVKALIKNVNDQPFSVIWLKYVAFIIPVFSAIRLAKFNHDTRQTSSFIGLPTPANAIFIVSLALMFMKFELYLPSSYYIQYFASLYQPITLCVLCCVMSLLLIAELPLFALKFKHFKWKDNEIRFVFLGLSLLMLITLQFVGIPLIIILYIVLSVINNFFFKKKVA